jgi:L,D-transpeptidase catalytic domain
VKKLLIPISVGLLCTSYTLIPAVQTGNSHITAVTVSHPIITDSCSSVVEAADVLYNNINLQQYGLSRAAFDCAMKGYQKLLERNMISRTNYLTICDFSQSSKKKRLYVIDVANNKLIINTYVAHGKNSGGEYATKFSNKMESLQSSLGFFITSNTYTGEHGLSLRIKGVDPGYNDKALERSIVIHGAAYVDAARANGGIFMGRSWGCPAVPQKESKNIIATIKNGTCLFIYHPSKNYLLGSKILNG